MSVDPSLGTGVAGQGLLARARHWPAWPELLLGACLNVFFLAMIVGQSKHPELLFVGLASLTVLVATLTAGKRARFVISPLASWGVLVMLGAVVAGYAANIDRYEAVFIFANVTSLLLALGTAYLVSTRLELDLRRLLAFHAGFAMLLMPFPLASAEWIWGRLIPGAMGPNLLGLFSMLAFIGGLGMRRVVPKVVVLATTMAVMFVVSSRGSMLASVVATGCYLTCRVVGAERRPVGADRTRRLALVVLLAVAALAVLLASGSSVFARLLDLMFKVNDPWRGLGTGASGRSELWAAAFQLWQEQPLLGVGFKGHASWMPNSMPAHSAYLGMLADTGLVGLSGYLMICGAALAGLLRPRRDGCWPLRVALVSSYLVYGFIESFALAFGNPYSVLFLWIALEAVRRPVSPQPGAAAAHQPLLQSGVSPS